jgi:hypothetical protein
MLLAQKEQFPIILPSSKINSNESLLRSSKDLKVSSNISSRAPLTSLILVQSRPTDMSFPDDIYDNKDITVVNTDTTKIKLRYPISVTEDLPAFIYEKDPNTGVMNRYLAVEDDKSYNTDSKYGINQEWLIFQRQGNQYDRIPGWVPDPIIAEAEKYNEQGYTIGNIGDIWNGPPKEEARAGKSDQYDEYKKYIEYAKTQIENEQ